MTKQVAPDIIDEKLYDMIVRRDHRVFAEILRHCGGPVRAKMVESGLSPTEADDLLTEVVEETITKYRRDRDAKVRTFFVLVARARTIDALRKRRKTMVMTHTDLLDIPTSRSWEPPSIVDARDEHQRQLSLVQEAMSLTLTDLERRTIQRHFSNVGVESTTNEGRSPKADRKNLSTALGKLRLALNVSRATDRKEARREHSPARA